MSLTQDIANLVSAAGALTHEVSEKLSEIDNRLGLAEQSVDSFLDGARDEFLIPNLPLPVVDVWSKSEHLSNDLIMTSIPRNIFLKKYDSVNRKYEGEEGFATHDSYAPSNDMYPDGLIQIINHEFGSSSQRYFMAFIRFGHDVVGGTLPSTVIKIEGVKTDNNTGYRLATLNDANFYSDKRAKGLVGGSVSLVNIDIETKGDPYSYPSWGGYYPIIGFRPIFMTNSNYAFLKDVNGNPYLSVKEIKVFSRSI